MELFDFFSRANSEYIEQLYQQYRRDPRSVDERWPGSSLALRREIRDRVRSWKSCFLQNRVLQQKGSTTWCTRTANLGISSRT